MVEEGLLAKTSTAATGVENDSQDELEPAKEESLPSSVAVAQHIRSQRRCALVVGGCLGLALLLAVCTLTRPHASGPRVAGVKSSTGLSALEGFLSIAEAMSTGIKTTDTVVSQINETYQTVNELADKFDESTEALSESGSHLSDELQRPARWQAELRERLWGMTPMAKKAALARLMRAQGMISLLDLKPTLRPKADLHDGNRCLDQEELTDGLCYKRCSTLTGGRYPWRVSAWSCCSHEPPCSSEHLQTDMALCGGFGVDRRGECPHPQGACLLNEEIFDGLCFKRCAFITFGFLPKRTGPSTCCSENRHSRLSVLDLDGCDTNSTAYLIGGGSGEEPDLPREVHPPLLSLTEEVE